MRADEEEQIIANEESPLLLPPDGDPLPTDRPPDQDQGNKQAFYLALALITLFQAGIAAPIVPANGSDRASPLPTPT